MSAAMRMLSVVSAIPVLLACGYLFLLALVSRRRPAPACGEPRLRFDVVVPAREHEEESGVARTVHSLLALDYPPALRRIIVTAGTGAGHAIEGVRAPGVLVMERPSERRGEGEALEIAFERSLSDALADAIVVVEAGSVVSANLLRAFSARLEVGATAVQARLGVRDAAASWRTRLMAIASSLFCELRSLGRERLGISADLHGNGTCLASSLLREAPSGVDLLVDDVEYGIRLALAGHRIHFAGEVDVLSDIAAGVQGARRRRRCRKAGRPSTLRHYRSSLLRAGLRRGEPSLLGMAIDLLVPPLAPLAAVAGFGLVVAGLCSAWAGQTNSALGLWMLASFFLVAYVVRGWHLSGTGVRGLADLLCAPAYAFWNARALLRSSPRRGGEWVRTPRDPGA